MKARGFTLVELIVILMLIGILAFVALPRNLGSDYDALAFRDRAASALRYAQKTATSHRRLVCATFTANSLMLEIATSNPASVCDTALAIAGGSDSVQGGSTTAFTSTPNNLFFQPDGRITSDGNGSATVNATLTIGNQSIAIDGGGSYVQ